jgi:CheY-like chemotaxis protein
VATTDNAFSSSSVINLKVLKRMLARLGVRKVEIFQDGGKAITALRKYDSPLRLPSLILTDLEMPAMNGFEFLDCLKESSVYEMMPTVLACSGRFEYCWMTLYSNHHWIFLTIALDIFDVFLCIEADWTSETEQRCLQAGFNGYLRKPLVLSGLRDFLAAYLHNAPPSPEERPRDIALLETNFSHMLQVKEADAKLRVLGTPPSLTERDLKRDQVGCPVLGFKPQA